MSSLLEDPAHRVVNLERRRYRGRIQIAAGILEIARTGSRKTRIMYLGNLSFEVLQKYLDLLLKLGMIEAQGRSERQYFTTEKGLGFLNDFYQLRRHAGIVQEKKAVLERSLSMTTVEVDETPRKVEEIGAAP